MSEFAGLLTVLFDSQWPPTVVVGAVLYLLIDRRLKVTEEQINSINKRLDSQNERLGRIETSLAVVKEQGTQNSINIAVLQEQVRRLDPNPPPPRTEGPRPPAPEARQAEAEEPAEAGIP